MLLLSTQTWMAVWSWALLAAWVFSLIGVIRDLEEPDRDMVEMRVAARHSGMPAAAARADLQVICHLNRVTAEVLELKKPSCPWQDEQKTLSLWLGVLVESVNGRLCLSVEPC